MKKLLAGDGAWLTRKVLLGWLIGSIQGTLSLPPHCQICLGALQDALQAWKWLFHNIASRPTSIAEVVRKQLTFIGACDASAEGMVGIWLDTASHHQPICWQAPFSHNVTTQVISACNPLGSITNLTSNWLVLWANMTSSAIWPLRQSSIKTWQYSVTTPLL